MVWSECSGFWSSLQITDKDDLLVTWMFDDRRVFSQMCSEVNKSFNLVVLGLFAWLFLSKGQLWSLVLIVSFASKGWVLFEKVWESVGMCQHCWVPKMKPVKKRRLEADKRDAALLLVSASFVCVSDWSPLFVALSNFSHLLFHFPVS